MKAEWQQMQLMNLWKLKNEDAGGGLDNPNIICERQWMEYMNLA